MNYDEQLYIRVRHLLSEEASFFASCSMSGRLSRRPGVITSVVRVAPGRSMFNWVVYERHDALLEHYETIAQVYDDAGVRAWAVWVDSGDELAVRELSRRVSTIAPMVYPRPPSRPCSITGPIRAVMVSPAAVGGGVARCIGARLADYILAGWSFRCEYLCRPRLPQLGHHGDVGTPQYGMAILLR
jgi:hypothetical protein